MSKLDRRGLLRSAFLTTVAAMAPLEVLAAMPGNVPSGTSSKALGDLAEAKRLIAAMIANDKAIGAAEEAGDKKRCRWLEKQYWVLDREFTDFAERVHNEPPRTWLDIVIRAEIAGYMLTWDKPRTDWDEMLERAENDGSHYDWMSELVMAVLYLAARSASEQPDVRAA